MGVNDIWVVRREEFQVINVKLIGMRAAQRGRKSACFASLLGGLALLLLFQEIEFLSVSCLLSLHI